METFPVNYIYVAVSAIFQVFNLLIKHLQTPLIYEVSQKKMTELSTIMLTLHKIGIFILLANNSHVDGNLPCQNQKFTYIYTIFQLFQTTC